MNNVVPLPSAEKLEPWRSIKDIATHYGFTTKWVYNQIDKGMPCRRVSGRWRFRLSEVDAWLDAQR